MKEINREVIVLEEDVNLDDCPEVSTIWPEDYETYLGDGVYGAVGLDD